MTTCVYALTPAAAAPPRRCRGLEREPLRLIAVGAIAAVVGRLRQPPGATVVNLRCYAASIESLARATSSLLPARFGTCVQDVNELTVILEARAASLTRALRAVRNRAQMTVRIGPPLTHRSSAEAPQFGSLPDEGEVRRQGEPSSGTAYLIARADAAARARQIPGFENVRAGVRRWVRDERVEKGPEGIATVYHLVPRGSADAYRRAVQCRAAETGLRVVVSGPWAPYAFATWEA